MSNIVDKLYNEKGVEIRQIFLEHGLNLEPTRENIAKALLVHKAVVKQGKKYDEFIPMLIGAVAGVASLISSSKKTPEEIAAEKAETERKLSIDTTKILAKFPDISKAPPELQKMLALIKSNPQLYPQQVNGQLSYVAAPITTDADRKLVSEAPKLAGHQEPEPGESAQSDGSSATEGNFFTRNSKKILIGFGVFILIAAVIAILKKKS